MQISVHETPVQAIILAAGRGTRMRPLSDPVPKPMLPVAGTPIAARVAEAAIAAGVLVDTAGFLQQKAQQTGEDSTDQVSNNIQVVSKFGEVKKVQFSVDGGGNTQAKRVGNITFLIKAGAGAGPIDMDDTTMQLIGDGGDATIQRSADSPKPTDSDNVDEPTRASFGLKEVSGYSETTTDSETIIERNDQRLEAEINLDGNVSTGGGVGGNATTTNADNFLTPDEELTVRITTASGATTTAVVDVPSTLSTQSDGDYVEV